ncbi:MAG: hypothetical protein CMN59_13130, partial [Sphingobium sp.]|nr:hypothetical protein [Sphingobium sp.]
MVQKIDATLQRADALVTAARDGATPRHVVDRIVAAGGDALKRPSCILQLCGCGRDRPPVLGAG